MITPDGHLILPDNDNAPGLRTIALSLAREWCWGRMCDRPFNVLAHTFLVADICRLDTEDPATDMRALMHDAPECICGDIPASWKTYWDRQREGQIYRRIAESYDLTDVLYQDDPLVSAADDLASRAVAELIVHPNLTNDRNTAHKHDRLPDTERGNATLKLAQQWIGRSAEWDDWVAWDSYWPQMWQQQVERAHPRWGVECPGCGRYQLCP